MFAGKLFLAGIRSYEAIAGAVGKGFAAEFLGFVKIWESLPSIDEILASPTSATLPSEPAALYAIATTLASRTTPFNAGRVVQYACRMPDEYGTLVIRDALRVCPAAANNRQFIAWATKHQDYLV